MLLILYILTDDEEEQEGKKRVRCDEIFSNMATPEMADYSKPVVYQQPTNTTADQQPDKMKSINKKVWLCVLNGDLL